MDKSHAFVIGGTKGAGRATVRVLTEKGWAVSVIARNLPIGASRNLKKAKYWTASATDTAALEPIVKAAERAHGKITSVVFFQRFRGEGDVWDGEIATSLKATKDLIELLTEKLKRKNLSIVIVSSINASLISKQLPVGYHVAKAGLNQMVRYFAVSLGGQNVRVNSVSPGTFLKDETKRFLLSDKTLVQLYQRIVPLKRFGTAIEVANTIHFLCSRESSFITGQDLVVDGGTSLVYQEALAREIVSHRPTPSKLRGRKN